MSISRLVRQLQRCHTTVVKNRKMTCGVPIAEMDASFISDYGLNSVSRRKSKDLAFQSRQVMLKVNPQCKNYRLFKHRRLELEGYVKSFYRT